jgi:hypothetical protein
MKHKAVYFAQVNIEHEKLVVTEIPILGETEKSYKLRGQNSFLTKSKFVDGSTIVKSTEEAIGFTKEDTINALYNFYKNALRENKEANKLIITKGRAVKKAIDELAAAKPET